MSGTNARAHLLPQRPLCPPRRALPLLADAWGAQALDAIPNSFCTPCTSTRSLAWMTHSPPPTDQQGNAPRMGAARARARGASTRHRPPKHPQNLPREDFAAPPQNLPRPERSGALRQVRVAATNIMPGRRVTANDIVPPPGPSPFRPQPPLRRASLLLAKPLRVAERLLLALSPYDSVSTIW